MDHPTRIKDRDNYHDPISSRQSEVKPYSGIIERLIRKAKTETAPPHISTVGFVTTNRLETLQRGLSGYIENSKRYGRENTFVIMDDSCSVGVRNDCRQMLKNLKAQYATDILYAGLEEKLLFLKRMIDTGDLPSEVAKFALFDTERTNLISVGANRNSLLLHTIGEVIVSADDDTECAIAVHDMDAGLAFSSGRVFDSTHPCKFWAYPDREAVKRSLNFVETDFLSTHECVLGKRVGSCITPGSRNSQIDFHEANDGFLRRLESTDDRVLVTCNGLAGDSGWNSPSNYLLFHGDSFKRLTRSEQDYQATCTRREVLRTVERITITDRAENLMTTFVGLDNRVLLPPFAPLCRGEDGLFGVTISQILKSSFVAHLPWIMLHTPAARSFWPGEITRSASGISFSFLLSLLVKSYEIGPGTVDSAQRMKKLGKYLEQSAQMPAPDFAEFLYSTTVPEVNAFISHLEEQLEREGCPTASWVHDVERFISIARQTFTRWESVVPLELTNGRSSVEALELTRCLVSKFGQLLHWWPDISEVARNFKRQGRTLAQPV